MKFLGEVRKQGLWLGQTIALYLRKSDIFSYT